MAPGIRIEHGRPETIIRAAVEAGEARAAATIAQQAQAESDRLEAQQQEFEYRKTLRQQDMVIDLQMNERSKMWEIEKMELRSRLDFEREEKKRQQVLDQYEASVKYINDSDLFDERTKERLLFSAKLKASKADIPGLSRILFPEVYERAPTPKQVSPTQRISAMRALREEEYREPTLAQRAFAAVLPKAIYDPYLTPEIQAEKQILQNIISGQYAAPTGTISSGLPIVKNDADFDALPSGTQFVGPDGIKRTKP